MQRLFAAVIHPLVDAVVCDVVVEVGAGTGQLTQRLVEQTAAVVHAVDPFPRFDPAALAGDRADRLVLHVGRSLAVLRDLGPVDLALLDGDPNWYTVVNELRALAAAARSAGRLPPVMIVHNVGWPFGRRDGYHDPDAIPLRWRATFARAGLVPGSSRPVRNGLSLVPYVAERDHQPCGGVRCAVEDFRREDPSRWVLVDIPGLHGVAVLAAAERIAASPTLGATLKRFGGARFLAAQVARVERERVIAEIGAGCDGGAAGEEPGGEATA